MAEAKHLKDKIRAKESSETSTHKILNLIKILSKFFQISSSFCKV